MTLGSIERSSWHDTPLVRLTDLTDPSFGYLTSQSCILSIEQKTSLTTY